MTHGQFSLHLPSPVRRLLTGPGGEIWVKDDGRISSLYGGNKPRKLKSILAIAQESRKNRLITAGAVGSHHVLATALLGRQMGFDTAAIVVARPYSCHAEQTTKEALSAGMDLVPVARLVDLPAALRCLLRPQSFWIPPGGSNAQGALGYLDAVLELEQQVRSGEVPEPDFIVAALGSGGTAAGILAGLACSSLKSKLLAVPVLNFPAPRTLVKRLARKALHLRRQSPADLSRLIEIDNRWVGQGYGYATLAGEEAIEIAARCGLGLESTYTGKAFAAALALLRGSVDRGNVSSRLSDCRPEWPVLDERGTPLCILFWSTISSTEPAPTNNPLAHLPDHLARLLVRK